MKNKFALPIILGFFLLLGSLFVSCAALFPAPQVKVRDLYSIETVSVEDIRGTTKLSNIRLAYETDERRTYRVNVYIEDVMEKTEKQNVIIVIYYGSVRETYFTKFMIKIDDQLFFLDSRFPEVDYDSSTRVREITRFYLDQDHINLIKDCESLIIQPYNTPITVSEEGIIAVKKYFTEN
ncbi:MAG: hypothetical protein FWE72_03595 [Spirochaetaceae bacterium]|nr:hypothetical protein [Spirochaetaceae bacterium]